MYKIPVKSFIIELDPEMLNVSDGPKDGRTQQIIETSLLLKNAVVNFKTRAKLIDNLHFKKKENVRSLSECFISILYRG